MSATVVTIRCNTCGAPLQVSPGGKRFCACGSLVAAPAAVATGQEAVIQPTAHLPWPLLVVILGVVGAGVVAALAMMDYGGGMYIVLVAGLTLLVVVVILAVIREMHKPLAEEPEEEPLMSRSSFLATVGPPPAYADTDQGMETPLHLVPRSVRLAATTTEHEHKAPPPFDAYQGDEPFLFASYSHQDSALVYPEIARMHNWGYRVWYDEGICPGREWPEEVAAALEQAAFFVVFISPHAVASDNVRNEINLAAKVKKPVLAIHLESTHLPRGIELQIGTRQAILKYELDQERYLRRLAAVLPAEICQSKAGEPGSSPRST